jgi:hypothetical protein
MGKVEFSHSDSTLADRIVTVAQNKATISIEYYLITIGSRKTPTELTKFTTSLGWRREITHSANG